MQCGYNFNDKNREKIEFLGIILDQKNSKKYELGSTSIFYENLSKIN